MQAQSLFALNMAVSKAGLTGLSGAATTFTTGNAVTYSIGGKAYSKAAVAGGATPTTDAISGAAISLLPNQGTVVVWALDAAGNVKLFGGSVQALTPAGNFLSSPPLMPSIPDDFTAFAYSVHKAGSTAVGTFTVGVSNWSATGLTHTVTDVLVLPNRPQTL